MIDYKQYYFYKYPRYQISKGISKGIIVDTEKRQIRKINFYGKIIHLVKIRQKFWINMKL